MQIYRIVSHQYSKDLTGTGAALHGGRWNPVGVPLLYTAQHRSLALCEMMVHLDTIQLQQAYDILTLSISDKVDIKKITNKQLPAKWNSRMMSTATQELGKKFAEQGKALILEVPSVVIPEESNFLLNPMHADFKKLKVVERKRFIFDKRLV